MIKYKICSKCKIEKPLSEFYDDKSKKGGKNGRCKLCSSGSSKMYYSRNKEELKTKRKINYQNNKEKLKIQGKTHYQNNREEILKDKQKYTKKHKKEIAARSKKYLQSLADYAIYVGQISFAEKISKGVNGELLVLCAYCGKRHIPTTQAAKSRIRALNGTAKGEQRFYCSESCKHACPTYGQRKYPKGFKKATLREVVPLLRQLVLERDDYTCQKCGATSEKAQLHVHHEKSYTLNKIMANDPDNCITLCKECHKLVHSQDGCKYLELKC